MCSFIPHKKIIEEFFAVKKFVFLRDLHSLFVGVADNQGYTRNFSP
jgi:hypothetical protein